jgi:hypothetical protein
VPPGFVEFLGLFVMESSLRKAFCGFVVVLCCFKRPAGSPADFHQAAGKGGGRCHRSDRSM